MKKLIPVFAFVIAFVSHCFGQEELLDVKILPNPSDISGYMGNKDYKSVKQRIAIIDYNINNRNAKDIYFVYFFYYYMFVHSYNFTTFVLI